MHLQSYGPENTFRKPHIKLNSSEFSYFIVGYGHWALEKVEQ
jgi:hypothetical protein